METDAAEDRMMKYLLGHLTLAEEQALEEEFFADDEAFAHLLAAEDELVDSYVNGQLTGADRIRFANKLRTTPEGRQKLENAQTLKLYIDNARPAVVANTPPTKSTFWQTFLDFLRPQTPAFQYALTAALLISVTGLAWFVYQNASLRNRLELAQNHESRALQLQRDLEEARRQQDELQRRLGEQAGQNETLAEQLRRETKRIEEMELELAALRQRQPNIITAVVAAGLSRGEIPRITVPSQAQVLNLQLPLPSDRQDYPSYSAAVNDASRQILSQRNLKPENARGGKTLVLRLSPRILQENTYVVSVKGHLANGRAEDVEAYQFSINKP